MTPRSPSPFTLHPSPYDVVVVGAGPAGAATATHLARAGRSVLLLDKARFPRDKPCAEYASPETEAVLRRLGAWSAIEAAGVRRLHGMIIVSPSGRRFPSEYLDGGQRRHSLALPRLVLDELLLAHARAAGADCRLGLRVEAPLLDGGQVVGVRVRHPDRSTEHLYARLVIGANGIRSRLARDLGGGRAPRWPRRLGLATHFCDLACPLDWGEMYVGRGGYCGLAPLANGLVTVAAALPMNTEAARPPFPGREGRRGGRSPRGHRARSPTPHSSLLTHHSPAARLAAALADQPALLERLAQAEQVKPWRGVGPLAWHVPRVAGPGFLLVGDAAGFFDPFTGEGIYRALRGAELAAEAALAALDDHDWPALARRYRGLRRAAFTGKERLARLIQVFVGCPPLLDYALMRLERRPELARRLSAALGDFGPPTAPLHPAYLARLLRP